MQKLRRSTRLARLCTPVLCVVALALHYLTQAAAWTISQRLARLAQPSSARRLIREVSISSSSRLWSTSESDTASGATAAKEAPKDELPYDYEVPEDAVIHIKPRAMRRLRELRQQQADPNGPLVLRMGVRSGGCSGMSYVMDIMSDDDSVQEDDAVDDYENDGVRCVVDAKSMLYLYGLELDYSDQLIGGGFQFFNPNAEESCGCGSSFGV